MFYALFTWVVWTETEKVTVVFHVQNGLRVYQYNSINSKIWCCQFKKLPSHKFRTLEVQAIFPKRNTTIWVFYECPLPCCDIRDTRHFIIIRVWSFYDRYCSIHSRWSQTQVVFTCVLHIHKYYHASTYSVTTVYTHHMTKQKFKGCHLFCSSLFLGLAVVVLEIVKISKTFPMWRLKKLKIWKPAHNFCNYDWRWSEPCSSDISKLFTIKCAVGLHFGWTTRMQIQSKQINKFCTEMHGRVSFSFPL